MEYVYLLFVDPYNGIPRKLIGIFSSEDKAVMSVEDSSKWTWKPNHILEFVDYEGSRYEVFRVQLDKQYSYTIAYGLRSENRGET